MFSTLLQCVEAPYSDVYPAVEEGAADVHDNCEIY